ncbi:MAG: hypothetical protein PHX51_02945 [Clostridia bacterium]|nr:hypothetical protein [Clostridia bacterium]
MSEHEQPPIPCSESESTCSGVGTQCVSVCLPADIKPYVAVKKVDTVCCNEPIVTVRQSCDCGVCKINITQLLCVKIHLEYGANVEVGEPAIDCN